MAWVLMMALTRLSAQIPAWSGILPADAAIDWSRSGVGEIPLRQKVCAELKPDATLTRINQALAECPAEQTVLLQAGHYTIDGTIRIPSMVTLRGAGADQTILNAVGRHSEYVVAMGSGTVNFLPTRILSAARRGATTLQLASVDRIAAGSYLVVSEKNNPAYVTSSGSGGVCRWCDGNWSPDSSYARGQIVQVVSVHGTSVEIMPGLYRDYTESPFVVSFRMAANRAGVEDLQVYANNTGYKASFGMVACAYCWMKGVEANFTDGDYARVEWGFRDEIRDSYFSNGFQHRPGEADGDLLLGWKTSASRVENNIFERAHRSIEVDRGAAGNVIGYNLTTEEFDSEATDYVLGGVFFHGAHPQFNLLEGNVLTQIEQDGVWGSSSHTTAFRNHVLGTNLICTPVSTRTAVDCRVDGHWGFQAARAVELSWLATRNQFVGNVVGSREMQLLSRHAEKLSSKLSVEFPAPRSYDAVAYGWSFGYGSSGDDGSASGCAGGVPPCHAAGTRATDLFLGNQNLLTGRTEWGEGGAKALPASFYLTGKPQWWGTLPFPAIGPDLQGGVGGHSYGNPAQRCYQKIMGGTAPVKNAGLAFRADRCYRSEKPARTDGKR